MLKGAAVHFFRKKTLNIAEKLIEDTKKKKKFKLINLFALIDVILGLILIYIGANYNY